MITSGHMGHLVDHHRVRVRLARVGGAAVAEELDRVEGARHAGRAARRDSDQLAHDLVRVRVRGRVGVGVGVRVGLTGEQLAHELGWASAQLDAH